MLQNYLTILLLFISGTFGFAFTDSLQHKHLSPSTEPAKKFPFLEFENYMDINYAYDFDKPIGQHRLFGSNPYYVNQFNLSYAFSQVKYENDRIKMVAAFATGGITKLMYLAEPSELKWVREMSLFYKFKKEGFGIEAGIMPSVYGVETFINRDNQHATRAIMTDFAPDFEIGARFHYKFGKHWTGKVQMTNGWQVLLDNNSSPAFGWVNIFGDEKKTFLNVGLFAGEEPYQGATNQLKLYANTFAKIRLGQFSIWPMVDFGVQKDTASVFREWYAYGVSAKYQFASRFAVAARYEHMNDPHAIVAELLNPTNQFIHDGYTLTFEYTPIPNLIFRLEAVSSMARTAVFTLSDGSFSKKDNLVMAAIHFTLPSGKIRLPSQNHE